jgi:hypothetical protein
MTKTDNHTPSNHEYQLTFDPAKYWVNTSNSQAYLIALCGYLPSFATHPAHLPLTLKEKMEAMYGFGALRQLEGSSIHEYGVHSFPGDPDLYPILRIDRGAEHVYIYEHGLVAFSAPRGKYFVTRMD